RALEQAALLRQQADHRSVVRSEDQIAHLADARALIEGQDRLADHTLALAHPAISSDVRRDHEEVCRDHDQDQQQHPQGEVHASSVGLSLQAHSGSSQRRSKLLGLAQRSLLGDATRTVSRYTAVAAASQAGHRWVTVASDTRRLDDPGIARRRAMPTLDTSIRRRFVVGAAIAALLLALVPASANARGGPTPTRHGTGSGLTPIVLFPAWHFTRLTVTVKHQKTDPACP